MFTEDFLRGRLGLLEYQVRWIADPSRFKLGLWSRQSGKDYTCAAEAVLDCALNPKRTWVILACGERQALESMQKAKDWAETVKTGCPAYGEERASREALMRNAEIRWKNGSVLRALPAKPQTIRGYSANLILTEFAFHEQAGEIWKAIYPSISNPLRGGEKKLRIITTPNGLSNCFHTLWMQSDFARHRVTIHEAVEAGLGLNADALKEGINDAEAWSQEYECEFVDNNSVLLPYELIASCESAEATETATPPDLSRGSGELFMGVDFGRKRDLTVCWVLRKKGNELRTEEVLVLEKASTPDQVEALLPRIRLARRVCLDYSGAGVGLGDHLVRAVGEWNPARHLGGKVELCSFTSALKAELFPKLRAAFERAQVLIPVSRAIREDLHGIHKRVTANGQVSYRAARTSDGHSDRCTALALALRAAE